MYKTKVLLILVVVSFSSVLYPQGGHNNEQKISGVVVDSLDSSPLYKATVALCNRTNGKVYAAAFSDSLGRFAFHKLEPSTYKIIISYIGYQKKIKDSVIVNKDAGDVSLGYIRLIKSSINTKEVNIIDYRPGIVYDNGKIIIDVSKLKISNNQTAFELLRDLPFITVDDKGKIYIMGDRRASVLLDGKESILTQNRLLEQLNINSIDKIEILSSPTAKYDAEREGGVIDIISRKNYNSLYRTRLGADIGTKDNYKASGDVSASFGKFNMFGSYYYEKYYRDGNCFSEMTSPESYYSKILYNTNNNYSTETNTFKIGLEYLFLPGSLLSSNLTYLKGKENSCDAEVIDEYQENNSVPLQYRNNTTNAGEGKNYEYKLSYNNEVDVKIFLMSISFIPVPIIIGMVCLTGNIPTIMTSLKRHFITTTISCIQ